MLDKWAAGRKNQLLIGAVATMVHTVLEIWEEKNLAAAPFMDVKGAHAP